MSLSSSISGLAFLFAISGCSSSGPASGSTDGGQQVDAALLDDGGVAQCEAPLPPDPSLKSKLEETWAIVQPQLIASQAATLGGASPNPQSNYNTQIFTSSLLMYAEYQRDAGLLVDLAELYNGAFDYAQQHSSAVFYWADDEDGVARKIQELPLPAPAWMWTTAPAPDATVGGENILTSAQFLYASSRLARIASEMGATIPAELAAFSQRTMPIALDHYQRWISRGAGEPGHFQVRGWGCADGTRDHEEHLQMLLNRSYGEFKSYCNALTDVDLWIIAGTMELLVASNNQPGWLAVDSDTVAMLKEYGKLGLSVVESRLSPGTVMDATDAPVDSLHYDLDTWQEHPNHAYAGYTGTTYPGWTDPDAKIPAVEPMPVTSLAWDISHARRLVRVFDTFYRFRGIVDSSFPDRDTLVGLARQFVFGAWNRNVASPQFTNYMDGTNGWYRVNYSNRAGFGYPPFGLNDSALSGGYGLWSYLEPFTSTLLTQLYEATNYDMESTVDQRLLVMSLPSIAPYTLDTNWCPWSE